MNAEKCPVCGHEQVKPLFRSCYLSCGYSPEDGFGCQRADDLAIERAAEVERLTAKLAKWESELSKVMPPDFKDWWQNSRDEWPEVARMTIETLKKSEAEAWQVAADNDEVPHFGRIT